MRRNLWGRHLASLAVIGLVALAADVAAQTAPAAANASCGAACHRAFDFWAGSWVVRDTAGVEVGRNEISRVSGWCALLESWTDARGGTGTSLNWFDPADGKWRQLWVGGGGQILRLEGGLVDGAMELGGRRQGPNGAEIVDRIRWTALPDGRVRQHWEISTGDGAWRSAFDGYYSPRSPTGGEPVP